MAHDETDQNQKVPMSNEDEQESDTITAERELSDTMKAERELSDTITAERELSDTVKDDIISGKLTRAGKNELPYLITKNYPSCDKLIEGIRLIKITKSSREIVVQSSMESVENKRVQQLITESLETYGSNRNLNRDNSVGKVAQLGDSSADRVYKPNSCSSCQTTSRFSNSLSTADLARRNKKEQFEEEEIEVIYSSAQTEETLNEGDVRISEGHWKQTEDTTAAARGPRNTTHDGFIYRTSCSCTRNSTDDNGNRCTCKTTRSDRSDDSEKGRNRCTCGSRCTCKVINDSSDVHDETANHCTCKTINILSDINDEDGVAKKRSNGIDDKDPLANVEATGIDAKLRTNPRDENGSVNVGHPNMPRDENASADVGHPNMPRDENDSENVGHPNSPRDKTDSENVGHPNMPRDENDSANVGHPNMPRDENGSANVGRCLCLNRFENQIKDALLRVKPNVRRRKAKKVKAGPFVHIYIEQMLNALEFSLTLRAIAVLVATLCLALLATASLYVMVRGGAAPAGQRVSYSLEIHNHHYGDWAETTKRTVLRDEFVKLNMKRIMIDSNIETLLARYQGEHLEDGLPDEYRSMPNMKTRSRVREETV